MASVKFGEARERLQQAKQDAEAGIATLENNYAILTSATYTNATANQKIAMLHDEIKTQNRVLVRVLQALLRMFAKLDKL